MQLLRAMLLYVRCASFTLLEVIRLLASIDSHGWLPGREFCADAAMVSAGSFRDRSRKKPKASE